MGTGMLRTDSPSSAANALGELAIAVGGEQANRSGVYAHGFSFQRPAIGRLRRATGTLARAAMHDGALFRPLDFVEFVAPVVGGAWMPVETMERQLAVVVAQHGGPFLAVQVGAIDERGERLRGGRSARGVGFGVDGHAALKISLIDAVHDGLQEVARRVAGPVGLLRFDVDAGVVHAAAAGRAVDDAQAVYVADLTDDDVALGNGPAEGAQGAAFGGGEVAAETATRNRAVENSGAVGGFVAGAVGVGDGVFHDAPLYLGIQEPAWSVGCVAASHELNYTHDSTDVNGFVQKNFKGGSKPSNAEFSGRPKAGPLE